MKFGADHYVPVLKIKRGEKRALALLAPATRSRMTPVLEIVENKEAAPLKDHLDKAFADLEPAVKALSGFFLDAREIASAGAAAAAEVFRRAKALDKSFVPVTGLARKSDPAPAVEAGKKSGVAIRLRRKEFEAGLLPAGLLEFLKQHDLRAESTDLLLDLGDVEEMLPSGIARLSEEFLLAIPNLKTWRTLTLVGCAFPFSLKGIGRYSSARRPRSEWLSWRDSLFTKRASIPRLPTFGDCVIQHPRGVEGFDPRIMPLSATIRYTLDDEWLFLKGESNDVTPLKEQFPRLAAELTMGEFKTEFRGKQHCPGCASMSECAQGVPGFGSPEAWRRLCTIHHISRTCEQIASLK